MPAVFPNGTMIKFLPLDLLGVSQNSIKEYNRRLLFVNICISSGDTKCGQKCGKYANDMTDDDIQTRPNIIFSQKHGTHVSYSRIMVRVVTKYGK